MKHQGFLSPPESPVGGMSNCGWLLSTAMRPMILGGGE